MELKRVVTALNRLAPVHLAEDWDNVGLLVEPSAPHVVRKLVLTNDLTEPVLDEALNVYKVDMIVSYHPPIFSAFKRINFKTWKERILVRCLENRIAVHAPHTSLDVVCGGITDWFIKAFDAVDVSPITNSGDSESGYISKFKVNVPNSFPNEEFQKFIEEVNTLTKDEELRGQINKKIKSNDDDDDGYTPITIGCTQDSSSKILSVLNSFPELLKHTCVVKGEMLPRPGCGLGRKGRLAAAITLADAVDAVKKHVGVQHVRAAVAFGKTLDSTVSSVAVCCGSGGSVLRGTAADLYVTGEMSHHDLLDAAARGTHVILTEHSNSERGFLEASLAPRLKELLQDRVEIFVSQADKDPVVYL